MSIKCTIAAKLVDGKCISIMCNWNGQPSSVGKMLMEHYNTQERVEQMILLGNISSLDRSIEAPESHSYYSRVPGYTVYFGRDRHEAGHAAILGLTMEEVLYDAEDIAYVWNGEWTVNGHRLVEVLDLPNPDKFNVPVKDSE